MKQNKLSIREMTLFSMLGMLMFCSKLIMEAAPNIHLLGMLTMLYTVAFRKKALIPIYVYVFVNGLYAGFNMWWIPYLYIWTILWAITMLLPKRMPKWAKMTVYPIVCALHGFSYGTLYAPAQAIMFGFNLPQTLAWIASGVPFDIIHGISNFCMGFLILPMSELLQKLYNSK